MERSEKFKKIVEILLSLINGNKLVMSFQIIFALDNSLSNNFFPAIPAHVTFFSTPTKNSFGLLLAILTKNSPLPLPISKTKLSSIEISSLLNPISGCSNKNGSAQALYLVLIF